MTSNGGDVLIGGLAGGNGGNISDSFATGNVTAVTRIAWRAVSWDAYRQRIVQSYATGNVNVGGTTGIAGGFVGINAGYLNQVFSTGAVTGNATSNFLGGFVGVNADFNGDDSSGLCHGRRHRQRQDNVIGGFAAVNTGRLEETYAIGKLTGGA